MATYVLETCDANDPPDEREYFAQGQYARAADALAAAQALIDDHLALVLAAGRTADDALEDWKTTGEIPRIVTRGGGAPVTFDALAYAQARVTVLARRA